MQNIRSLFTKSELRGSNTSSLRTCLIIAASICVTVSHNVVAQTVRDSAGIRIVMNEKPSWTAAQQLKLATTPSLVIGDKDEEPYQLTRVRGAFRLSDGRILVAEGAALEIRVYDPKGTYLRKFGAKGDGPGEFRQMESMVRLSGDTIAVMHERDAISRFTAEGKFIKRTDERGGPKTSEPMQMVTNVGLPFNGGARLLLRRLLGNPPMANGVREIASAEYSIVDSGGKSIAQIGSLPHGEFIGYEGRAWSPWMGTAAVMTGNGSSFLRGYPSEYSITRYTASGVPNLIVRRAWNPVAITGKDVDAFVEEWLKRWSKPGKDEEKDRADFRVQPFAKSLPAFSALLLDSSGHIWARTPHAIDAAVSGNLYQYAIAPNTWSVFGATGVWLGNVNMPPLFMPTDIGADYVMGVLRDGDNTPTVVSYKLGTK